MRTCKRTFSKFQIAWNNEVKYGRETTLKGEMKVKGMVACPIEGCNKDITVNKRKSCISFQPTGIVRHLNGRRHGIFSSPEEKQKYMLKRLQQKNKKKRNITFKKNKNIVSNSKMDQTVKKEKELNAKIAFIDVDGDETLTSDENSNNTPGRIQESISEVRKTFEKF